LLGPLRAEEATAHNPIQTKQQRKEMETATVLKRQTKDTLVSKLLEVSKDKQELNERLLAAAVIGGVVGFVIGLGW
jgi:16S rRNA G1207 methylase RsmC